MNANADTTTRYMYILTVAEPMENRQATLTGTVDVRHGSTRLAVWKYLVENDVKNRLGYTNPIVLYYSLEPDSL
jgi:hypothetical protein